MAFPSPRPVRSSSSKSLRTSLTSFPRPFCSFHVFRLCKPSSLLRHWPSHLLPSVYPEAVPLNRSVQIQSKVQKIVAVIIVVVVVVVILILCQGLSNLGFDSQREPLPRCQTSSTYPPLSCDSARCRKVGSNRREGPFRWNCCFKSTEFPAVAVAREEYRMKPDSPV